MTQAVEDVGRPLSLHRGMLSFGVCVWLCVCVVISSLLLLMREQFLRLSENLISFDDNSKIGVNLNHFSSNMAFLMRMDYGCTKFCDPIFFDICIGNSTEDDNDKILHVDSIPCSISSQEN